MRRQVVLHELTRRRGEEDLTAVGRATDPGRAMDGEADIALPGRIRLARVDADPDAYVLPVGPLVPRQRALDRDGSRHGIGRAPKRSEERIALRVNLVAAVLGESLTNEPLLLAQNLAVALATQPLEELRRALDVGEQKRDGATTTLRHVSPH